ncbi:hypothetical protein GCM10027596_17210 [Nocardioides korecus]
MSPTGDPHPVPDHQDAHGEQVGQQQGRGVVRQPRDHGLDHAVVRAGDLARVEDREQHDQAQEQRRGEQGHGEGVARAHRQRGRDADQHQPGVEDQAQTAPEQQVGSEGDQAEHHRQPDDAGAGHLALFPQGGCAHERHRRTAHPAGRRDSPVG